jgi:hypothetical protein
MDAMARLLQAREFHVKNRYLYNRDYYVVALDGSTVPNRKALCSNRCRAPTIQRSLTG